jgi:hypothetical protein
MIGILIFIAFSIGLYLYADATIKKHKYLSFVTVIGYSLIILIVYAGTAQEEVYTDFSVTYMYGEAKSNKKDLYDGKYYVINAEGISYYVPERKVSYTTVSDKNDAQIYLVGKRVLRRPKFEYLYKLMYLDVPGIEIIYKPEHVDIQEFVNY